LSVGVKGKWHNTCVTHALSTADEWYCTSVAKVPEALALFSLLSHWALPTFHKKNKNVEANSSASSNIIRWLHHEALQRSWFKNKQSYMNQ
jgi:hypothetical protein